jgi:hypothetical protein
VVREGLGGWEWDGVGLGVGVGEADGGQEELEAWDECCAEWGLEFVHARGQKGEERNEFGGELSPTPSFNLASAKERILI